MFFGKKIPLLAALMLACISAVAQPAPADSLPLPDETLLQVDLKLGTRLLQAVVRQAVGHVLPMRGQASPISMVYCNYAIAVAAPATVQMQGLDVVATQPLLVEVDLYASMSGTRTPLMDKKTLRATLTSRSRLRLGADWRLAPKTAMTLAWQDQLSVSPFGLPITIDLEMLNRTVLNNVLANLAADVDKTLAASLLLRPEAEKVWNLLASAWPVHRLALPAAPGRTPDSADCWLRLMPRRVYLRQEASTSADTLVWRFQVAGHTTLHLGAQPAVPDPGPLPPLRQDLVNTPTSQVVLGCYIPVALLQGAAAAYATGMALPADSVFDAPGCQEDYQLRILSIDSLYQDSETPENLLLKAAFTVRKQGKAKTMDGQMQLSGTPAYLPLEQLLTVDGLDYRLRTSSPLLGMASLFLRQRILRELTQAMRLPLGPLLDQATLQLNQVLGSLRVNNPGVGHARVHTRLGQLHVHQLQLLPGVLFPSFGLTGVIEIRL